MYVLFTESKIAMTIETYNVIRSKRLEYLSLFLLLVVMPLRRSPGRIPKFIVSTKIQSKINETNIIPSEIEENKGMISIHRVIIAYIVLMRNNHKCNRHHNRGVYPGR